ncbi:hypothetical protein HK100_006177 [Physocladia obscura]|uniref:Enhancer of translation termination 1 n=1 Tax=Physocladia obscura TaxID=109957 RepID=A0AAD5XBV0_9FUNG|nr:hypothetical protein HK100_006177 [Physocladia obscura]
MAIKKRPGGLKKATAEKNTETPKSGERLNTATKTNETQDSLDSETITVALSVSNNSNVNGDHDDENDESEAKQIQQTQEMLAMALAKLAEANEVNETESIDATDEAAALLRGVVHESDRILRVHFAQQENSNSNDNGSSNNFLPPAFHLAYGEALLRLALLMDTDSDAETEAENGPIAFLDAAVSRFETGLEVANASKDIWMLNEAIARALIHKANILIVQDPTVPSSIIDPIISSAHTHISAILKTLGNSDLNQSLESILLLVKHADIRQQVHPEAAKRCVNIARLDIVALLKFNDLHVPSLIALAQTYMTAANDLLDAAESTGNLDDMDEDDSKNEKIDFKVVSKLLEEALKYTTKAQIASGSTYESGKNVTLQLLLGEIYVNKANLLDENENEDEANKFYKLAVSCFKAVETVDAAALPDAFDSFLRDWESEIQ